VSFASQNDPPMGVWEMLGEFFREAAVLIFVFAPLDQAIKGQFTFWFLFIGMLTALAFLAMGMVLEKLR
jgi:hypothetical protein